MSCNTQELSRFGIVDTFFCWQKMCVAPDFEVRSLSEPCEKRVQSVKAVGKSAGGPRVFTRKRACRLRRIINLLFFWVVHPLMISPWVGGDAIISDGCGRMGTHNPMTWNQSSQMVCPSAHDSIFERLYVGLTDPSGSVRTDRGTGYLGNFYFSHAQLLLLLK